MFKKTGTIRWDASLRKIMNLAFWHSEKHILKHLYDITDGVAYSASVVSKTETKISLRGVESIIFCNEI